MVEVHCSPSEAPTEILPVLAALASEETMADPSRRSGEYKVSPETEALMKSVREAAVAEATRDHTIQNLTKELGGCVSAITKLSQEVTESNKLLATVANTQTNHASQLEAIWDEKKSKGSAWHAFWPTVVGSILSALILAMFAMSGAFTPREVPAPAAPPTTKVP